jgi:hypothetical protein
MVNKNSTASLYYPMKFFIAYIFMTMLLHYFGPWVYSGEKIWLVVGYMVVVIVLFCVGYHSVVKPLRGKVIKNDYISQLNYKRFYLISKVGLMLQFFLTLIQAITGYSDGLISLSSITNPGQIYIDALELAKIGSSSSLVIQIKTLLMPVLYLSSAYLIFNYPKLSKEWRYGLIFTLVFQLIIGAVTKGAQKGFFDLLILVASVSYLRVYFDQNMFRRWLRYSLYFLFLAITIFFIFQISRLKAYDALGFTGYGMMSLDKDGLIFSIFGNSIGFTLSLFVLYLSQGYYGLSLAMQIPFEWTYGVGNSFALMSYADQYFGVYGIEDKTYPFRMAAEFDWPAKMYWHTFFPWAASDLTFVGAAGLMYLAGRVYARSMIDGLVYESPLGISVFYFMTTFILFLPANNQLMQTREMMLGFLAIFVSWLFFGSFFRRAKRLSRKFKHRNV